MSPALAEADAAWVHRLQRGAFEYFLAHTNEANGLVADTSRAGSPCSIAVVGFALSCYPIAVERGWLTRKDAGARVLATMKFFADSVQSTDPNATGYQGFFYHFLDMQQGRRVWQCELSLIDTGLLLAGVLVASLYFDQGGDEMHIRALAQQLHERVDWRWALHDNKTLAQGWKPESGFLHYGWEGYNEATILYIFAMASTTHPLPRETFEHWQSTYQWENLLGVDILYSGPLFTHLFSHAWIDFRGIQDRFMRDVSSDYYKNTQNAIAIQREYTRRNPGAFTGYDQDCWGITAGDGPSNQGQALRPIGRRFYGYMSRGVPYGPDDGTIAPWAMLAALPFAPQAALEGTRQLLARYPQVCSNQQFASGFNPSYPGHDQGWLSPGCYGLDQGILAMMIENHRTGMIWELTRRSTLLRRGLQAAGFSGGWLGMGE